MRTSLLALFTYLLPAFAFSFTLQLTVWNETCGNANGAIRADLGNATFPVTYAWSNGGSDYIIQGLVPGWYTLTVTDNLGQVVVDSAEVLAVPNLDWSGPQGVSQAGLFGCEGCNAGFSIPSDPDIIWWFNVNGFLAFDPAPIDSWASGWIFGPYCATDYPTLTITDSTGCTGTVQIAPLWVSDAEPMTVVGVTPACNGANGSITVDPMGGGYLVDMFSVTVYDDSWNILAQCSSGFCSTPTYTFTDLPAGTHAVVRAEQYYDPYGMSCPPETLYVTVPDLAPACGLLSGTVYIDNDEDCAQGVAEVGVPYSVLEIQPGPEYAITNSDGHYMRPLVDGSYTLAQTDATLIPICPLPQPVPFVLSGASQVIDLADSSTVPLDLMVHGAGNAARPGFVTAHSLLVRNLSPQVSGPVSITYVYDPVLAFVSVTPTPTSISGNTFTWDLPGFTAYAQFPINLQFIVPGGTALGTLLSSTLTASNTLAEPLANNSMVLAQTVTGSVDPNDKTAHTSSGYSDTQYFIGTDEWLEYVIRFQNTGTDTAFTVVVTDTLDAALDMTAYEQGAASHPFSIAFKAGRVVEWTFANILLPDSGTNEAASHGLVQFRIKPVQPLLPGNVISNAADIYFDFNAPVHTNDAVVTAETSTAIHPVAQAAPCCRAIVTGDRLMLYAEGDPYTTTAMRLLSMDGRVVRSTGTRIIDPNGTSIPIDDLKAGSYMLWVGGADGREWAFRFAIL